jgi:hypothetical protein
MRRVEGEGVWDSRAEVWRVVVEKWMIEAKKKLKLVGNRF